MTDTLPNAPKTYKHGNQNLVELRNIVKSYKTAAGEFVALRNIDIDVDMGEFVAIIGKSGSGKSTLINMITGIDRPTSGQVLVGDEAVDKLNENQMARWRGRNLGIVFQFFQLLPTLSVIENIMLPMDFCNMYTNTERTQRALMLLDMVEMDDHAYKLPTALSGGQQQRVAIARALANDPPILLADEPTGNLDSKMADVIFNMFEHLVKQNKTVIMVTHDSSLARRASRTILLADGEVVNQFIARALPTLTPQQLLKASHKVETLKFNPGATILHQDDLTDKFYIVSQGTVEIALKRPGQSDVVVARYGPGQYFGEVELIRGGKTLATVRAARENVPVEVLALDRETFIELMNESEDTKKVIDQVVQLRFAENVATRGQNK